MSGEGHPIRNIPCWLGLVNLVFSLLLATEKDFRTSGLGFAQDCELRFGANREHRRIQVSKAADHAALQSWFCLTERVQFCAHVIPNAVRNLLFGLCRCVAKSRFLALLGMTIPQD